MKTTKTIKPKFYRDNINNNIPCVKLVMDMPTEYVAKIKTVVRSSLNLYNYIKECEFVVDAFGLYEIIGVAYLNRRNEIINLLKIGEGGFSGAIVDFKKIIAGAVCCGASGIILFHNHPSGNLLPSEQDKVLTKRMKEICNIMEINLLDHLILGLDKYYSFADEGIL